jgi:hypothetical protein
VRPGLSDFPGHSSDTKAKPHAALGRGGFNMLIYLWDLVSPPGFEPRDPLNKSQTMPGGAAGSRGTRAW